MAEVVQPNAAQQYGMQNQHVHGGGNDRSSEAAVSGGRPAFFIQDDWNFAASGGGSLVDETHLELDAFLRTILLNEMIAHKNAVMTHRLDWCRQATSRTETNCENSDVFQRLLDKTSMGVIPRKVDDLYSWLLDLIIRAFDDVFRIEPTPRPNLSQEVRDTVREQILTTLKEIVRIRAQQVIQQITGEYAQAGVAVTPDQAVGLAEERGIAIAPDEDRIRELTEQMHNAAREYEDQMATAGAQRLSEVVKDLLQSTESLDEIIKVLYDFCTMPYAVMTGGELKNVKKRVWKKRKAVYEHQWLPSLRRVSPWDFFWTADSTDCHNGTAVAERIAMRRFDLKAFKSRSFTFSDRIDKVLDVYDGENRNWLAPKEGLYSEARRWSEFPHETIDVFRMFIRVTGEKLRPYMKQVRQSGKKKIAWDQEYHIEAYLTGNTLIALRVHDGDHERPYNHVSYEPVPSEFSGNGLPENLAVIHAASRKTFQLMIRNMAKSTNPAILTDREMFRETLGEDDVLMPDSQYDFHRPLGYTGKPVHMVEFPNYTGQAISFQEYLDGRADIESGIPKYALGQAQGLPSALRSVAALKLMIDSALKTMTSRVFRLGRFVIAPGIRQIVTWVVDSKRYPDVDVDSEVVVQGTEGAIRKVMVLDNIQGLLQYLAPFANAGLIPMGTLQNLVQEYLVEAGVGSADVSRIQAEFEQSGQSAVGGRPPEAHTPAPEQGQAPQ